MQLNNLEIINFRTIGHQVMNPGKINVITGPNGAGKSSAFEAISYLLTGKVGTNPVRCGCDDAIVRGSVMGVSLERKCGKKNTVRMNEKATTQKSVQQWFDGSAGLTAETVRIATSSGLLASMSGKDLSAYLIGNNLIPATIDMETIKMLCSISPQAEEELSMHLPLPPAKFEMDSIEEAYSHFYAARPIVKKQIAEKKAQASFSGMTPVHTLEQIDKELARFSAYAAEMSAYNQLLKAYMDAKKRREEIQAKVNAIEAKIRTCTAKPVDVTERNHLKQKEMELSQNILKCNQSMQTIKANVSMFQRTLDTLDKPVCPISNKLICTTDKTAIRDELTELISQNTALLLSTEGELGRLQEKLKSIRAKLEDFDRRKAAYQEFEALHTQRKAMLMGMPSVPDKPEPPTEIKDAENAIKALKVERELIFMHQTAKKAELEIPALEKQIEIYDELINLLKPQGGIREKVIEAAFEPLIEHANERAKVLRADFEINLVSDDGINILCKPNGTSELLPLSAVSSGEQALALFLILDAINALSGCGIMMLDDLDKLDAKGLDALFSLLSNPDVTDPYDHIFIAMVNHKDSLDVLDKHKGIISNMIAL